MTAQEYLEKNWDKSVTAIGILSEEVKLSGELIIQDYPNLQEINLPNQELTALTIINCPNLKQINLWNNQLTKLEIQGDSQVSEIIAGGNELTTLNLANCSQISKLMVADNPYLNKLIGLNLSTITNINITNTLVNLSTDLEALRQENKELCKIIKKTDDVLYQKELVLPEPIQTLKQAEEAIQRRLAKTATEWKEYFLGDEEKRKEYALLHLSFRDPILRTKGQQILKLVLKAQTNHTYEELIKEWSGGEKYNPTYDFDGSLDELTGYFKKYKELLNTNPEF